MSFGVAVDERRLPALETGSAPPSEETEGNERLTAATGAVLLVLLAVIGVTLLRLRQLLWVHLFVGTLLIGPLALKLATTGYRFVRYYTGDAAYRRKGPPPLIMRASAPLLVLTTVLVLVSGVVLLFAGPGSRHSLLPLHKIGFIVWAAFFALHTLWHLPVLPRSLRSDYGHTGPPGAARLRGRDGRALALAGALVAGLVAAVLVIPQFGPWLNR
jgi:hypothetical protein